MRKVVIMAAMTGLMLAVSPVAYARGGHGFGASAFSPGHMFRAGGAHAGYPGASYYAPGRQMQMNGGPGYTDQTTRQYYPGATYWTPHLRTLRGN